MLCHGRDATQCVRNTDPVSWILIDREHREYFQQTGGFMMDERFKGRESFESVEPTQAWVGSVDSEARRTERLAAGQCWRCQRASWFGSAGIKDAGADCASTKRARAGSHETCCLRCKSRLQEHTG